MTALLAASVIALGSGAACLTSWRRKLAQARALAESPTLREAVPEIPGLSRLDQVEAVRALCCVSDPYVVARLALLEAEVSEYAELLLELDDQSPRPSGPAEDH